MAYIHPDENIQALQKWTESQTPGHEKGVLRLVMIGGEKKLQFVPMKSMGAMKICLFSACFRGKSSRADILSFLKETYSYMPAEASIQEFYKLYRERIVVLSAEVPLVANRAYSPPMDAEKVARSIVSDLRQKNAPDFLDHLRKRVPSNVFGEAVRLCFKNNMPTDQKMKLREYLKIAFPQHAVYMEYTSDRLPILISRGIQHILNYLRTKEKPAITLPCTICETPEDFLTQIDKLRNSKEVPQTFIVRCRANSFHATTSGPVTHHVTPFYVSRTPEGQIRLLWTDSVGGYVSLFTQLMNWIHSRSDVELFCYGQPRQVDDHSCPIFAIHDIIQANKTHESRLTALMDAAGKEPLPNGMEQNLPRFFEDLPLTFMIPTQSYTRLHARMSTSSPEEEQIERGQVETKLQRFQRMVKTSTGQTKMQNSYADRRSDKYEGLLWQHIIASQKNS